MERLLPGGESGYKERKKVSPSAKKGVAGAAKSLGARGVTVAPFYKAMPDKKKKKQDVRYPLPKRVEK